MSSIEILRYICKVLSREPDSKSVLSKMLVCSVLNREKMYEGISRCCIFCPAFTISLVFPLPHYPAAPPTPIVEAAQSLTGITLRERTWPSPADQAAEPGQWEASYLNPFLSLDLMFCPLFPQPKLFSRTQPWKEQCMGKPWYMRLNPF